jgi:hypothetical protein
MFTYRSMKKKNSHSTRVKIKTGRRENPAVDGPRDRTVCFMLSDREKLGVDRVAFCMNLTRSGILANVTSEFVTATGGEKTAQEAEKTLFRYLRECRKAVRERGAFADRIMASMKGNDHE